MLSSCRTCLHIAYFFGHCRTFSTSDQITLTKKLIKHKKYAVAKQVVKIISHEAASGRTRMVQSYSPSCANVTPFNTPQSAFMPYRCCPLLIRFEYIDLRTCPGMTWAGPSPSKLP